MLKSIFLGGIFGGIHWWQSQGFAIGVGYTRYMAVARSILSILVFTVSLMCSGCLIGFTGQAFNGLVPNLSNQYFVIYMEIIIVVIGRGIIWLASICLLLEVSDEVISMYPLVVQDQVGSNNYSTDLLSVLSQALVWLWEVGGGCIERPYRICQISESRCLLEFFHHL